jgi:hypothetical protein
MAGWFGGFGVNPWANPKLFVNLLGYTDFPKEIGTIPKEWLASAGNVVFYERKDKVSMNF